MVNSENSNFIPTDSIAQVRYYRTEANPMDYGAESATRNIYTAKSSLLGRTLFEVPYFTKHFAFTSMEQYVHLHTAARHAQLPVLDIYVIDKDSYAMPDITADGSVILDRHFLDELARIIPTQNFIPEDLIRRANIVSANQSSILGGLEQMATEINRNANRGGLTLPFDNGLSIWLRANHTSGTVEFSPQPLLLDFSFLLTNGADIEKNAQQTDSFRVTIKDIVKKCSRIARRPQ